MNSRYPLSMHRLDGDVIASVRVQSAEQEAELAAAGWSPTVPELPATPEPITDDTAQAIRLLAEAQAELGAQIAELQARLDKLESKRGPGRPPRE